MDFAIVNTWLITFHNKHLGIIENGTIGVKGNRISYVGPAEEFDSNSVDRVIEGSNHVTMPGLVNAHIHTGMTILRGGAQDLPEIEWMNKGIGPIAKHMSKEDIILGSKLGVIEGLRTGTTTFVEYTSNVANLVEQVYLPFKASVVATETINEVSRDRAHLKPTDLYTFDRNKGEEALKRNQYLFKQFASNELVDCHYGPQALDMISLDLLQSIKDEAVEQNTPVHMHIAQGRRERLQIMGRYGKDASTVKVLSRNNLLDDNLICVHCHDTTIEERRNMAKSKVKMVGCPSSIGMIDGIVPPVYDFVELGTDVGLGSDQAPGPGTHNMFREMRTISILTKTLLKCPTALPAWKTLNLATLGGARVLKIENKIGSLEAGKKADIITVDLNKPNMIPSVNKPFRTIIPNLVYSATGYEVDNVIINGELIISEGMFTQIDEDNILKEANKRAQEIFEQATEDWISADSQLVKDVKEGKL